MRGTWGTRRGTRGTQILGLMRLWSGGADGLRRFKFLEVFLELTCQLGGGAVVGSFVGPGVAGVQNLAGDARATDWNVQAEGGFLNEFDLIQSAFERGIDEGAGDFEAHALACAKGAAGPAGIDQPAGGVVLPEALAEHLGIDVRGERQEGRTEAGGELGDWLLAHAGLGACELRCISREEVIHGLLRCKTRYGRQDAKGIGGQEHYIARMASDARDDSVLDVIHRVGGAGVFCETNVSEVGLAGGGVEDDVLQHRAKANGVVDLRLFLFAEVDALRIAPSLKIKNPRGAPAVLVVADKTARGVGGEGCLTGAGEAEKQCGNPVCADVGRAVHRQNLIVQRPLRQQEIHHAEDGFFHLAGVFCAADENDFASEIGEDKGRGAGAVALGDGLKLRGSDDGEIWRVHGQVPAMGLYMQNMV